MFYFVSLEATTPVERIENAARITFHLMASNPYAYAKDTKAEVVGVAGKDSVVPLLSTQAAHFVQGSPVFAYPAIELEFEEDAAQYEITNETTGEILRVKWDFKAGDKLQVNFRNRRIEVNNVLRMNAWDYTTKFWKLRPGDNKIDADPVGKTYLSYRAVFL
nr:phage tail domain-containing protein [Thalassobacillus sp. C254]